MQHSMARMTRTQISLDPIPYDFVKSEAVLHGVSLSEIVRTLIEERMAARSVIPGSIMQIAGLIQDGTAVGLDHDRLLAKALVRDATPDPALDRP